MKYINKFYLDKEKDIIIKLYKVSEDEIKYILETPNHNSGNLITNLSKVCNLKIELNEKKLKIITGIIPAEINDNGEEVYILKFGKTKVANIYMNGRIERKAKIPSVIKVLMAQTKDYDLPIEKTIIKSYISKRTKFRTDLHTHMNQILDPDVLIALAIKHQIRYKEYYIKKLNIIITLEQRKKLEEKGPYKEKSLNFADLILNNLENAEENIIKIRNSLVLMKDGQAVFTDLEKSIRYRYAIIKAETTKKEDKINITNDLILKIPDKDIKKYLIKMVEDLKKEEYKNNTFFQDKLLWIARSYQKQGIEQVEISMSDLSKKFEKGIKPLVEMHKIIPYIEKETGVNLRFLVAISRTLFTEEELIESPAIIKAISKSPYVVGMDLIGEEVNNISDFTDIIGEIVKYAIEEDPGYTIQLHAGENDNLNNIEEALNCIKICVPNGKKAPLFRIGHGLYVPDLDTPNGKRIINKMKDLEVVLEFQLSSNVRLNNLTDIRNHPIKDYLKNNIKCVQGTDGCGFYGIDTIDEQIAWRNLLDVTEEEFEKMCLVEKKIINQRKEYFEIKSKKFNEFLDGKELHEVLYEEEYNNLSKIQNIINEEKGINHLNSVDIFQKNNVNFPDNKIPIIIAGGSFNSKGRVTRLDKRTLKDLKTFLEKINSNKTYFLIGHKIQGYEKAILDISKELNKDFDIKAIIPKYVSEEIKDNIINSNLNGVYISPEPSELGIYKSFNYEIFERKDSIVVAFDGNSPVSNLIQEAKNGKGKAKIYVNGENVILKEKAKHLEGYVKIFNNEKSLTEEILKDNPDIY